MRLIFKLLLINALAACGAPGSDSVFVTQKPEAPPISAAPAQPSAPRLVTKSFRGWYRRLNDTAQFQPCGAKAPFNVRGTPAALAMLREHYRFSAPWQGAKMFSVFEGAVVTDTLAVKGVPGDSTVREIRPRFMLVKVDSMRSWLSTDCGGVRTP